MVYPVASQIFIYFFQFLSASKAHTLGYLVLLLCFSFRLNKLWTYISSPARPLPTGNCDKLPKALLNRAEENELKDKSFRMSWVSLPCVITQTLKQ